MSKACNTAYGFSGAKDYYAWQSMAEKERKMDGGHCIYNFHRYQGRKKKIKINAYPYPETLPTTSVIG